MASRKTAPMIEGLESRSYLSANVVPSFAGTIPTSELTNAKTKDVLKVDLSNTGTTAQKGSLTLSIFLTPDATGATGLTAAHQVISKTINIGIKAGKSKVVPVKLGAIPNLGAGQYFFDAQVVDAGVTTNAVTSSATTVAQGFTSLTGAIPAVVAKAKVGKTIPFVFTVTNNGNIPATGTLEVELEVSIATNGTNPTLVSDKMKKIDIKKGQTKRFILPGKLPATVAAGTYYSEVVIDPKSVFGSPVTVVSTSNFPVS